MKQGMATTSVEDSPSKVASSSKKKPKDKSSSGSSLKGSLPNSLFGGSNSGTSGGGVTRMDVSELPAFQQNDRSLSSLSGSDGKMGNFTSGLKNHSATPEINSSPAKSSKRKSGSESSNSGERSGGQGSMTNSTHPSEAGSVGRHGISGTGRGFSSGSSDGEDEQPKHNVFRKTRGVKPPQSASAVAAASSLDSDDEATDSADEGNSGGEERGGRRRGRDGEVATAGRQSDRLMTRKDSSESTNSANSPAPNPAHTTSTIFVESTLPKEPMNGATSVVNMAVGYGAAAESMAPPSAVFDKTPSQSPPGTPIMDSPKHVSDGARSPGTPITLSPSTTDPPEVCFSVTK